jgi:hypothetical protein
MSCGTLLKGGYDYEVKYTLKTSKEECHGAFTKYYGQEQLVLF